MPRLQRPEPLFWALESGESSKEEMALELHRKNETGHFKDISSCMSRDGKASCLVGRTRHWDERERPDRGEAQPQREREQCFYLLEEDRDKDVRWNPQHLRLF